jgi:ELWxxDGT repeat protein
MVNAGGTLYFTSDDGARGRELWKSDGTPDGTVLVRFFPLRSDAYFTLKSLAAVDGTLFFSEGDAVHAQELWRSDGTESGTVLVQDLALGPFFSGSPEQMTLAGSRMFFTANDPVLGRELWAGHTAILAARPDRALEDLRDDVLALGLPNGIEQSLLAKLDAVAAALSRARGVRPAIQLLRAFEREVEQKSVTPIPEAQAADLLDFAGQIEDLLEQSAEPVTGPFRRTPGERSISLDVPRGR